MIPDKESWCDSVIPIVILEAIDVIQNQLRTPRCYPSYCEASDGSCTLRKLTPVNATGKPFRCVHSFT